MSAQKILKLKNLKLGIMMLAAGFLALLPTTQLMAAQPNYGISLTGTVNKHQVKADETFTITLKLKNTGKKQLNNVKVDWAPSRLEFAPFSGSNGGSATKTNFKIAFSPFNSGGERTYSVQAKFKSGVAVGSSLDNMPRITAGKVGAAGTVSDSVNDIGIKVINGDSAGANNNNEQKIWLTARVLKYEQNPTTDNYLFNEQNPLKIEPGKWFQIQFKLKNTSGNQLKNVDMNWAPKSIVFPQGDGKRGPNGKLVSPEQLSIKFTPFNKGAERIYTVMAKFKNTAVNGETINAQNQGNMPKITANLNNKQVTDTVRTINAMAVTAPVTPDSPLQITKSTDTPSPRLDAPFKYLISVKNTSNIAQKVTLNDMNTAPAVQSFTAVTVEGATESTLKIVSGEEAVKIAEDLVAKLAVEIEGLPVQTEVQKALKVLKQSQYAANQVRVEVKKAKLAVNQAKNSAAKKNAQQKLKNAQQKLEKAKQAAQTAWKAYQAALKVTGEQPAVGTDPAAAEEDKADVLQQQILNGSFTLAAGATANITLTSVIANDSEAANAILNSVLGSVEGGKEVKSNETTVSLCRTTECSGVSEVVNPGTEPGETAAGDSAAPASIPSTGPGAIAAGIVGVSALGYGARQWMASRRAMHDAMNNLYKKD